MAIKRTNIRESYWFYYKHVSATGEVPLEIKYYVYIVVGFMKFLMKKILEGNDIRLPADMGILGVRGKKVRPRIDEETGDIKGLPPHWSETKKLWNRDPVAKANKQLVYCFNEDTNGMVNKLIWFKKNSKFKHKTIYSFRLSRGNKKTISQLTKAGKEYLEKIN